MVAIVVVLLAAVATLGGAAASKCFQCQPLISNEFCTYPDPDNGLMVGGKFVNCTIGCFFAHGEVNGRDNTTQSFNIYDCVDTGLVVALNLTTVDECKTGNDAKKLFSSARARDLMSYYMLPRGSLQDAYYCRCKEDKCNVKKNGSSAVLFASGLMVLLAVALPYVLMAF